MSMRQACPNGCCSSSCATPGAGRGLRAPSGETRRLWDAYRSWLAGALRGGDSRAAGPSPGVAHAHAHAHRPAGAPMSSRRRVLPVWCRSRSLRARMGRRWGRCQADVTDATVGRITLAKHGNGVHSSACRGTRTGARFLSSSRCTHGREAGAPRPLPSGRRRGAPRPWRTTARDGRSGTRAHGGRARPLTGHTTALGAGVRGAPMGHAHAHAPSVLLRARLCR